MCNEMQLKSGIYWNTSSHKIIGFASNLKELDLRKEIQKLNNVMDACENEVSEGIKTDNSNAKKVTNGVFEV